MKEKIDDVLNDIVSIQNQISGLQLLLKNKKNKMAKYFEKTGYSRASNDNVTVYVQNKVNIKYDIDALKKALDPAIFNEIIKKKYEILDAKELNKFLKKYDLSLKDLQEFIKIEKNVDEKKLNEFYESGKLSIESLEGCYEATNTKSIAIRMAHPDEKIPIN